MCNKVNTTLTVQLINTSASLLHIDNMNILFITGNDGTENLREANK